MRVGQILGDVIPRKSRALCGGARLATRKDLVSVPLTVAGVDVSLR